MLSVNQSRWRLAVAPAVLLIVAALALAPARPAVAQRGVVRLTLDRGEGATYAPGDPIVINYTVPGPGRYRLTSITDDGAGVVEEGTASGTGGTIHATVGDPAGRHTLRLELSQVDVTFRGETYFYSGTTPPAGATSGGGWTACNSTAKGNLAAEDHWSFSANGGTRFSATVGVVHLMIYPPRPTPTPQLRLLDPAGNPLAEGNDAIAETALPSLGIYTLVVRPAPGGPGGTPDYTLQLNCSGPAAG